MAVAGGWLTLGTASAWLPPCLQDTGMGDDSLQVTLTHWVTLRQFLGLLVGPHFPTGHPARTSLPLLNSKATVETEWLRQRTSPHSPGAKSYLSAQNHMEKPHLTCQASHNLRPCDL